MSCHTVMEDILSDRCWPVKRRRAPVSGGGGATRPWRRMPGPPAARNATATRVPTRTDASSEQTHHLEGVVFPGALERLPQEPVLVQGHQALAGDVRPSSAAAPLDEGDANVQRQAVEIPDATGTGCRCRSRAGLWWMLLTTRGSRKKGVHDDSLNVGWMLRNGVRAHQRHVGQTREKPAEDAVSSVGRPGVLRFRGGSERHCAGAQRHTDDERDVRYEMRRCRDSTGGYFERRHRLCGNERVATDQSVRTPKKPAARDRRFVAMILIMC
jgi:hypothetical protein